MLTTVYNCQWVGMMSISEEMF